MAITLKLPDDSPENKRRMVAASGGYNVPDTTNNDTHYVKSTTAKMPIAKFSQSAGGGGNVTMTQPMFFSPMHTPMSWQTPARRRELIQWARHYYLNEPKVAAGIDFYATFSQSGFKLECKDRKILKYYEKLAEKLELTEKLQSISHDYFLLGDVFPFLEIECPNCKKAAENKEKCKHPDGTFKAIKVMNPDYIEVKDSPITTKPEYYLMPDDELKQIVQRREPRKIYESLPEIVRNLISAGQPIPLSDKSINHLKHNASDYATYGTPMMQRLFVYLAYKTKIMTANWIVSERLIIPVRVVKVGDEKRPATESDLQDVQSQLAAVANDPNLTLITHHSFELDWIGASGKIHNITPELELVGKEILDGLMLNQALLNGEAVSYSSSQVGVETLIKRLETWRNKLKDWVERRIFLPIAMMQGFIDEEESKKINSPVYLYPKFVWNDLQLRDKTNRIQTLMQLNDKGLVSAQTLLEELDLDYDSEVEKMRNEQVMASATGQIGGMGNLGTMGMGGGAPGGAPGEMGLGDMAGELGGMVPGGGVPPAGGMGGAPGGGMALAPAGGMGAAAGTNLPIIGKRGSKSMQEKEQEQVPQAQPIKLTSLENKMYKMLLSMNIKHPLFGQYSINVPGEQRPFSLDFAYPDIGVCTEVDGKIWHETEDFKQRDLNRDQKLANVGWRILRFREDAIEEQPDAVRDIIYKNVVEAEKAHKKASQDNQIIKYSSVNDNNKNPVYDFITNNRDNKIGCYRKIISDKIQILYIGTIANGD